MSSDFSEKDLKELELHGIAASDAQRQLDQLRNPPPHRQLERACAAGDGVVVLNEAQSEEYANLGRAAADAGRVGRFVPASGAASRMFKHLMEAEKKAPLKRNDLKDELTAEFFDKLDNFAFTQEIEEVLHAQGINLDDLRRGSGLEKIIAALLREPGLNYASLPKALIKFHRSPSGNVTALEEQLKEALLSVGDKEGKTRIHFTVTGSHRPLFEKIAREFKQGKLQISYSEQKLSTDTLAVDGQGKLFRDAEGKLLFRPGGHGSLLDNLNDLKGDIVQIKNIDNIASDKLRQESVQSKQVLTGLLVELQEKAHHFVQALTKKPENLEVAAQAAAFIQTAFHIQNGPIESGDILQLLNRPIRVCGVVKNQGEPGGGPFWIKDAEGRVSAQIVESAEVDTQDKNQKALLSAASHFNPVDLVVGLKDFRGKSFDLAAYRDDDAVFIAEKSFEGRPLRALERPGLWNGAMAGWLTLFVEVPLETFNPVKTVNDLLRPAHQP